MLLNKICNIYFEKCKIRFSKISANSEPFKLITIRVCVFCTFDSSNCSGFRPLGGVRCFIMKDALVVVRTQVNSYPAGDEINTYSALLTGVPLYSLQKANLSVFFVLIRKTRYYKERASFCYTVKCPDSALM